MDYALSGSIYTILVFVSFIGVVIWAYSKKSKNNFDEAQMLIFDDEPKTKSESKHDKQESKTDE
ncbi:MAG: cytochrome c oxidase cbb3-type subunit 4 [Paraglaciecola sp.]|mgnify:FL=1|jgi:cytochrome c oxidase cbb3-type subunit 4|uniref:cbb3-type cytochrome oxidase subunit 3 n=1 Tax=uncultured Paraglaciecola sp. TaxID=1765024 RepID=UPI0025FB7478|nr:cbb3-type cytochrome c oxidase subunit 3 [uncultured Paraglaciecola sp.]